MQTPQLLENENHQRVNGQLLDDLADSVGPVKFHVFLLGVWHKHHVSGQMARGLVVFGVRKLPRKVGHSKVRVKHPTNEVVDVLEVRKCTVATLVGQNPKTKPKKTNQVRLKRPKSTSDVSVGNLGNVGVSRVPDKHHHGDIPGDVAQRTDQRALVAVLGDGLENVLDGVIRNFERVAEGVCSDETFRGSSSLCCCGHGEKQKGSGERDGPEERGG